MYYFIFSGDIQIFVEGERLNKFEKIRSRLGYHVVYDKSIEKAIDYASANDFASIQIDLTMPKFFPEKYDKAARRRIREYAEKRNVEITLHLPGEDFSLQTLHSRIRSAIIERIKEIIDFARDLGATRVTIHPGIVPVFTMPGLGDVPITEQYPGIHREMLDGALRELSRYAEGKTQLCVENSPFSLIVMDVLEKLLPKEKNLFLTWDIAKAYRADGSLKTDVEKFFLKHIDRVRECHLHDRTDRGAHDVIGKGKIDFVRYLNLLGDFDVGYTIEVRPRERALQCLKIIEGWKDRIK